MKVWVLRSSFQDDHYARAHMTEKGVLMGAVQEVSEHMYSGYDDDEIEDFERRWPTSFKEDLNRYTREQLRGFLSEWWECLFDAGANVEYQIYQTHMQP